MNADIDMWIAELKAAGWKRHATNATIWVHPSGAWYTGPFGAWKAMKQEAGPSENSIQEAKSHLKAILIQAIPSDDKIIIDHVTAAYISLGGGLNDFLTVRPFGQTERAK